MRRIVLQLALVALVAMTALTACGGGDAASTTTVPATTASTTGPDRTTTHTEAETTTTPTTEPQTTTTTTTPVAGPCAPGPIPGGAVGMSDVSADFDGDGAADTLTAYGTGSAGDPAPWHIRLDRAAGGSVDAVIPDATGPGNVRPLGGAEMSQSSGLPPDGSGVEAFVQVGSGASVALIGIFQYQDCTLVRLAGSGSPDPLTFAVGGTVTHLDGLSCEGVSGGQRLIALSATSDDGVTYTTSDQLLVVAAGQFTTPNPAIAGSLDASDPGALAPYSTISCPGVSAP